MYTRWRGARITSKRWFSDRLSLVPRVWTLLRTSRHIRRHKVMGLQRTAVKRNTRVDKCTHHHTARGWPSEEGRTVKKIMADQYDIESAISSVLVKGHHLGSCSKFPTFCMQFSSLAIHVRGVSHPKQIIEFFFVMSIV